MPFVAALVGLAGSIAIEQRCAPRPRLARPLAAWGLHVGVWLILYSALTLVLGRPWFAMAIVSAGFLLLVVVNNAKVHSLREAFVVQDFEYFTDAIRHPRLYIPFLGWWRFLAAVLGFAAAVGVGLWAEEVPRARFALAGQAGALMVLAMAGLASLVFGTRRRLPILLDPNRDMERLGLVATLWEYGMAARRLPDADSPLTGSAAAARPPVLPHLVAVQSESFFDPRGLFDGIRAEVLSRFDRVRGEACVRGGLQVPAWGANTVRTECAFLTGVDEARLGVHRFNPYRAIAAGWNPGSLAAFLRSLGYRTVCIHPYPSSFYQRDRVFPRLGFEEFIDIGAFSEGDRFGPYVGDVAVAEMVIEMIRSSDAPLFVFVITMENHGPLHLERVEPGDIERLYTVPPPPGCEDLTIYLRHLQNADRMIGRLADALSDLPLPAGLCWYGDHVPIMPHVYEIFGVPGGKVEYVLWRNDGSERKGEGTPLNVSSLSRVWMESQGLGFWQDLEERRFSGVSE